MTDEKVEKESTEDKQEDVKADPPQDAGKKEAPEKITLTKQEYDNQLAQARRKADAELRTIQAEYKEFRDGVEKREQAANDAAAEKVETLRKDIPESVIKLLDKLTPIEQLEWLSDPENAITKKEIPALPQPNEGRGGQRKSINIL